MNRERKLKYNTVLAIVNQVITILCGFILPRFYLQNYGSQVYGLVSSITQFLGFVTLMELGMGAVVQSSLYIPLAKKDNLQISKIIISAEKFFRKIATIFLVYTIILAIIYPMLIQKEFGWWFEASLVLIISISSLAEYFFGITYKLLLTADQKAFISLSLQSIGLVFNFVLCIILMNLGASIQCVKLVSAIVLLIRPIGQNIYVHRHYSIEKNLVLDDEPIKQKWNGIAQHIAYYVTNNTDTIVLSVLSTLENVSIYAVYNMIASGVKQLVLTLNTGVQALYGNMLARNEIDQLSERFKYFEWKMHNIVTVLFSCVALLIMPFISIYTRGIDDTNYYQPTFAMLITLAQAAYCIRLPYNTMICAAGHYKQTQTSAIMEMVLNLGITIMLVKKCGLIGVAIGTLIALTYRTIYLAYYLSKNIINYKIQVFWCNLGIDMLIFCISALLCKQVSNIVNGYLEWVVLALKVGAIVIMVSILINYLFHKKYTIRFFRG